MLRPILSDKIIWSLPGTRLIPGAIRFPAQALANNNELSSTILR